MAFRYLTGGGSGVAHLVALDGPVNGANPYTGEIWRKIEERYGLVHLVPGVSQADKERVRRATEMFRSPAATELEEQGRDPMKAGEKSFSAVQALRKRGMTVWTYVNPRDIVVAAPDASISGFSRDFTRGADLDYVIWPGNVEDWLVASADNHGLITRVLDDDPVALNERASLCSDLEIRCGSYSTEVDEQ